MRFYTFLMENVAEKCVCVFLKRAAVHCNIHSGKLDELIFITLKWNYSILLLGFSLLWKTLFLLLPDVLRSSSSSLVIFLIVPVVSFSCCPRFVLIYLVSLLKVHEEGARESSGGDRRASQQASVPFIRISFAARRLKSQLMDLSALPANKSIKKAT